MRARPTQLAVLLLLTSCRSVGWEGEIERHGSLREVLALGQTQGRVRVADAGSAPDAVGIGVLAGLEGEVTIGEGSTWVSRAGARGTLVTNQGRALEEQAAFLVVARVEEWVELPIESTVALAELGRWAGLDALGWPVVPFVVRGALYELDAHVVNGACPFSGAVPAGQEPVRRHAALTFGTLIGFFARDSAGVLTHPGEDVHAHVIVRGAESWTAHVERVLIGAGATLLLPLSEKYVTPQFSLGRSYR